MFTHPKETGSQEVVTSAEKRWGGIRQRSHGFEEFLVSQAKTVGVIFGNQPIWGSHFSELSCIFIHFFAALKDNLQIVAGNSFGAGKEGIVTAADWSEATVLCFINCGGHRKSNRDRATAVFGRRTQQWFFSRMSMHWFSWENLNTGNHRFSHSDRAAFL